MPHTTRTLVVPEIEEARLGKRVSAKRRARRIENARFQINGKRWLAQPAHHEHAAIARKKSQAAIAALTASELAA
jgi:hypothetical protein